MTDGLCTKKDFLELAKERCSVRKFSNKKVEAEKVDLILEAARLAPTACNNQPQRILVLNSDKGLDKLKDCTNYHFDAPLAFIICYDSEKSWKRRYDEKDEGDIDASIVTCHMMLEIANLGLGSTWVGSFDPAEVKKRFTLPDNIIPVAILPTGYKSEDSVPHPLHNKRLSKKEFVFYNRL